MISRFKGFILSVVAVAMVAALTGCAGSKSSSSSSMDSAVTAEQERNQKLEDAKRSAEDAEAKAHQLREEKNRSTAKSGNWVLFSFNLAATDDEKIQLAGEGEKNFIGVERTYKVKLLTRNPGITIQASEEAKVKSAHAALERMRDAMRTGHQLTDFYVSEILAGSSVGEGQPGDFTPHLEKPILMDRFGKPVQPKTRGQARFISVIKQHDIVLAAGPAGTGKTFLAVAMAVQALEKKLVERIILVRPAVESGESLGFLPGAIGEKIGPYMRPLYDSLAIMMSTERLKEYEDGNAIEIAPLAYMRGRTLGKCFIILDEAQNTSVAQMKMFLTRIGIGSKAVLTGDESQVDLDKFQKSGFAHARKILTGIEGIGQIELTVEDVVRHRLVREIIKAYEKSGFPT